MLDEITVISFIKPLHLGTLALKEPNRRLAKDQIIMSTPPNQDTTRYSLTFTVPHSSLSACKDAVFAVGAGTYGPGPEQKYTRVCFLTPGVSEFTPGKGAEPKIGRIGREERVEEMRVHVMCEGRAIAIKAVDALKR